MRALRFGWVAMVAGVSVQLVSVSPAQAGGCGDFGGIGVALGAMIGGGTAVATSFALPGIAVAAEESGNLNYWPGVGWAFLGSTVGVGAGTGLSASVLCEAGVYLPALNGLGIGVVSTIVWAATTPTERSPSYAPQFALAPLGDDGATAMMSLAF